MDPNIIGKKLNVDGVNLHYEYSEGPVHNMTIVFESGYGWDLNNWLPIKDEVSIFANVFMYDRDGIGKSERSERPKHSLQIIENLRRLLKKANIRPPYILVGHSFGGLNVRLYAGKYPDEVAGVILLDSSHEDQNEKMVPLWSKELQEDYFSGFSLESSLSTFEESLEQVRAVKSLGTIPLTVLTGSSQPHHTSESWACWTTFQKELANMSSNSKYIIVENAGHAVHIDKPKAVIEAIREMVEKIE
ncbi:alpha/beta hydrolase [Bacillus sp. FJAT-49711]|uniref:alpha/beta fold hydrolase n=1 Tax=Bacillus sp. FJAT-49711 TaxID=2833585 RepID=UPI001BC94031|nr:alpha/beta hydrolase [Bacillus sp. FJAT-49711]MBS4220319.1 alpha/beta hydrolase [Bacillus sp. FJAT-49711]